MSFVPFGVSWYRPDIPCEKLLCRRGLCSDPSQPSLLRRPSYNRHPSASRMQAPPPLASPVHTELSQQEAKKAEDSVLPVRQPQPQPQPQWYHNREPVDPESIPDVALVRLWFRILCATCSTSRGVIWCGRVTRPYACGGRLCNTCPRAREFAVKRTLRALNMPFSCPSK